METRIEYKINPDECARKHELPRLMQHVLISYSSGGLTRMLAGDYLIRPAPTYPKNHKKTELDLKRDELFFRQRDNAINRVKIELMSLYQEAHENDPELYAEIHSLLSLKICESCHENSQCSNYQNYLNQRTRKS